MNALHNITLLSLALCLGNSHLILAATPSPPPKSSNPFFEPSVTGFDETNNMNIFQVTIDPRHRTSLSAEIVSTVIKVPQKMGSAFRKGDLLIQLNDVLYQSNLEKAQAALIKAKTELDAKNHLFHDNQGSLFELKEAEANFATAKADLALAQRNFSATKILAPYDGKIISVEIEEFETPQLGKTLIDVVDDKVLVAKFLIPSSYLPKIKVGTPFQIEIRETGRKYQLPSHA
jgi:RND family efflux transporter MFP subunit